MIAASRRVSLLTGDHDQVTGGHLYNRHMADQAVCHHVVIEMVRVDPSFDPRVVRGQVVVDSLVAAEVSRILPSEFDHPLTALVHQVPGGVFGTENRRRARRSADLDLYDRCQMVIAASTYLADELADAGVATEKLRVVPPGSDISSTDSRPLLDLRGGARLGLLNVANWLPNKGIVELLDVMDRLPSDVARLHLVGSTTMDTEYAAQVRARLEGPDLAAKVAEHGLVPTHAMMRLYRSADVLVLTSSDEGYGTVIAEALAGGVPVIAWGSGNIPNLFDDGREGFQIEPGDIEGFARAISTLAGSASLLSSLSSNAALRGETLPTWRQSGARFFAALSEARQMGRPFSTAESRNTGSPALGKGPADRVGTLSMKESP